MNCTNLIKLLNASGQKKCFTKSHVAKENGKSFELSCKSGKVDFCKVKIDDCFITSNTVNKCDYMFVLNAPKRVFLVELKGTDIDQALKQIKSTYHQFKAKLPINDFEYQGYVVTSRVPAADTKRKQRLEAFKRENKFSVLVRSRKLEVDC